MFLLERIVGLVFASALVVFLATFTGTAVGLLMAGIAFVLVIDLVIYNYMHHLVMMRIMNSVNSDNIAKVINNELAALDLDEENKDDTETKKSEQA